jgi:hypothetical protein
MKRVSPAIIAPLGLAALLILIAANDSSPAHSASFNPVATICLDDQTTVDPNPLVPGDAGECDGSNAPGANVALTSFLGIGLGPDGQSQQGGGDDTPDYNFGATMTFSPPEWGIARGTDMPIGAIVGRLSSITTLGLLGNPCRSPVLVPFTFVNASIDPANTIIPKPPGERDRLEPLAWDANGNYVSDGADKWPAYLNDIFSGVPASDIRARLFGVNATAVADTTIVLNIVVLEPGTPLPGGITPDPRLGYPAVTVLQDPTAPASSDDPVSDFCSPLSVSTTVFGVTEDNPNTSANEGGNPYRQNPGDGAYSFLTLIRSLPDADGDGVENPLDPCPLTPDPNWNPRGSAYQPGSDDDADGLPNSCDPHPVVPSPIFGYLFDEDRDWWGNRWDNCPLVPNTDNSDSDGDGIGDACDPHPNDADAEGVPVNVCVVNTLEIGAGGTPPIAPGTYQDCDPNDLVPELEPPPHDNLADSRLVTEGELPFTDTAAVAMATIELGETFGCFFLDSTVWYKFTPSTDQVLTANTMGSSVPEAFINVYGGPDAPSFGDLSFVTCGAGITFNATGGTTYYFQLGDGYGATSGSLVFNLRAILSNDSLANAHPLTEGELPFTDTVDVAGAAIEVGEIFGCFFLDSTVWYKFTPSTDQVLTANTMGSSVPEAFINVYSGPDPASFADLALLTCGSSVSFTAVAGTTYYFQVGDGYGAKSGSLLFNLDGIPSTPEPTPVTIDIKPGGDPNSTNLGSQGVIPVAVLTTDTFDASSVDPTTVDFEGASPLRSALEDVDDDGDTDLIMHFRTQDTNIADEATEACLTGETFAEEQIEGCDSVRIVPPEADADGDSAGVGLPRLFGDDVEATLGTDQFSACGPNAWPPDMNDDGSVNILDVFEMLPFWLGASSRHDLNTDGSVNIVDVFRMFPFWMDSCT